MATMPEATRRSWVRRHPWWTFGLFVFLLIASNIADWQIDEGRRVWGQRYAEARGGHVAMVDVTGLPVRENPLPYHVIVSGDLAGGRTPVLLMHGSPGAAYGFEGLAEVLSRDGRPVIWLDLPGFASQSEPASRGRVFDNYSSQTYAAIMWRVLDALGVERAHLVGWSNSGAVGLHMADTDPERTASLTLLAAVGAQDTEGSGQHAFEHIKYKIGKALLVWGAPLYPHFGVIGPRSERRAFLGFFDDTDQRPLAGIMEQLTVPTLVLHGRDDFLVPAWGAERHHALIPTSGLVMVDASHFFPMTAPGPLSGSPRSARRSAGDRHAGPRARAAAGVHRDDGLPGGVVGARPALGCGDPAVRGADPVHARLRRGRRGSAGGHGLCRFRYRRLGADHRPNLVESARHARVPSGSARSVDRLSGVGICLFPDRVACTRSARAGVDLAGRGVWAGGGIAACLCCLASGPARVDAERACRAA
jgi:pimeloyl-ACP methyl ester carboxylesterase